MLDRIHGKLIEKKVHYIVVDVHGLGYAINVPMSTLNRLPEVGDTITLYTHFVVREDSHSLYGFWSLIDRKLFRDLIKVNGVGPKLGLAILSSMDAATFVKSVLDDNTAYLTKLPGVGAKTAQRLVVEMKDRLNKTWVGEEFSYETNVISGAKEEAIEALLALGYKTKEATKVVNSIKLEGASSEEIIRAALQKIAVIS